MFTGTIEDELIAVCERMGYGLDLNYMRGRVTINPGSNRRRDDHVFTNATHALMWAEAQERKIRNFG